MNKATQKRAGGQHNAWRRQALAIRCNDSRDTTIIIEPQVFDGCFANIEVFLIRQSRLHRRAVQLPVRLRARPPHGWPLTAVQHSKLNARTVYHLAHQAIQRVDLANQMPLSQAADRRVA
jgi:hypothetical protein